MSNLTVISLGGSIIVPDEVDISFLTQFNTALRSYLAEDKSRKVILVCGGGAPARLYQQALKAVVPDVDEEELDWLGIRATQDRKSVV